MRLAAFLLAFAFMGITFAGSCPAGGKDCFLCGGVDGIPCTTNCTGAFREGVGNVACECPQGKGCTCYCPYEGASEEVESGSKACAVGIPEICQSYKYKCGRVNAFDGGKVLLKKSGTSEWCVGSAGAWIAPGDVVWTSGNTTAKIIYYDESDRKSEDFYLGKNAVLEVKDVATKNTVKEMVIHLLRGPVRMFVTHRNSIYRVETPEVVIGVRGTDFILESDGSSTSVKVFDGSVDLESGGKKVVLEEGEYSAISSNGATPSEPAKFDIGAEDKWWEELDSGGGSGCGSGFILPLILLAAVFLRRA